MREPACGSRCEYGPPRPHRGLAALHMATRYMRLSTVKLLLDLGADPEVADDCGRRTLILAREILKAPKGNLM